MTPTAPAPSANATTEADPAASASAPAADRASRSTLEVELSSSVGVDDDTERDFSTTDPNVADRTNVSRVWDAPPEASPRSRVTASPASLLCFFFFHTVPSETSNAEASSSSSAEARRTTVDARGVCGWTGRKLRLLSLDAEQRSAVRDVLLQRVGERRGQLQGFARWLDERPPFDYVLDAANIGYDRQNFEGGAFSYAQIAAVAALLRSRGAQRARKEMQESFLLCFSSFPGLRAEAPGAPRASRAEEPSWAASSARLERLLEQVVGTLRIVECASPDRSKMQ